LEYYQLSPQEVVNHQPIEKAKALLKLSAFLL